MDTHSIPQPSRPVNPATLIFAFDADAGAIPQTVSITRRGRTRTYRYTRWIEHTRFTFRMPCCDRFAITRTATAWIWRLLTEEEYARKDAARVRRNQRARNRRAAIANGHRSGNNRQTSYAW